MAQQPKLKVVLTGYGPFAGVPENPTELLVERLVDAAKDMAGVELVHAGILITAAQEVDAWVLTKLCPLLEQERASGSPVLVLHLGLDSRAQHVYLEHCATNSARFRKPDERGCQLFCPIDGNFMPDGVKVTGLDLTKAATLLKQRGHPVQTSWDAGRFLCNWVYYRSLELCNHADCSDTPEPAGRQRQQQQQQQQQEQRDQDLQQQSSVEEAQAAAAAAAHRAEYNCQKASDALRSHSLASGQPSRCYALFVHVPPFSTVAAGEQLRCLHALLEVLSGMLCRS